MERGRKQLNCLPTLGIQLRKESRRRCDRFLTTNSIKIARLHELARDIAEMVINRVNGQISLGTSLSRCEAQQRLRLR